MPSLETKPIGFVAKSDGFCEGLNPSYVMAPAGLAMRTAGRLI